MYLEYFGLSKPPFRITPDTHVFFEGSDRGPTLNALAFATDSGEGTIKVVGEVGTRRRRWPWSHAIAMIMLATSTHFVSTSDLNPVETISTTGSYHDVHH